MKQRVILMFAGWLIATAISANNTITISSTQGAPGEEVTISIGLENSDAVSTMQVSIPLDESLTLVESSGQLGSRCTSYSLTVGVKEGVLHVFVYSLSMAAFTDNSGEVASFKLQLGNQPQTLSLIPVKAVLTSPTGQTLDTSVNSGSVTTVCAKAQYSSMEVDFGEVPIRSTYERTVTVTNVGNDDLTITDLIFSDINVFSSTNTLPMTITAGQSKTLNVTYAPVERGSISKTLKVECNSVSKLNTITLKAKPFAVNELHIQPTSGISDEEVTISMVMNNMDDISGFQVEFDLPSQFEYVDGSFAPSSRKQDHQTITSLNGQKLRIIAYSATDKPLIGEDGEIGSFRVKLIGRNGTTLTPSKTVLSATINNKVENVVSAVYGGYITIQSPQINCDNTLNFGAVSVTESCKKTLTVRNYGNAPLTISRVTFDNEHMSIKEELPIVISSWGNKTLTVDYSSVEQVAFEGTMNIYSNDPDQRLKTVTVSGSRFAPNYLGISANNVFRNGNLEVNVSVDNYDAMTGLQFDIVYPGQYFEPFDNNYLLTDRATGMTVTTRVIDSNTLRCFCYFLTGGQVAAGNGKIMTMMLQPTSGNIPAGNYNVSLTNIKFGTSELDNKYAGAQTLMDDFEVIDALKGDANNDGVVDAQDASLVLQYVAKKIDTIQNADVNNDGVVDAQDASLILQYVAKKISW